MREPAGKDAEEKSNLGRKREVGGHADKDSERESGHRPDRD
jgi:hypothetical protein